ncbi:MAG: 3-isopropylmalate dehydrogenase [archaeon]|nr:3-isopropylmalate dehydrogenase [archaeon]
MALEKNIVILEGDGIGPEIMREGVKVLNVVAERYGHKFNLTYAPFGAGNYLANGSCYPEETRKQILAADAVLKGPVGLNLEGMKKLQAAGVKMELETILALRKDLDTYVCYRPVILPKSLASFSPLKSEIIGDGLDILMMRELVGGIYFGDKTEGVIDGEIRKPYASDDCTYTNQQVERFARVCFKEAKKRNAKLTNVSKPNVLATSRYWDAVFKEVAREYPDIKMESIIVDNLAFQLCKNPRQFNGVMALENMQGDILTDQAGGILGSLGLMPSACVNPETGKAYFEPSHGSAPDIAGQNKANPYSMIGSVAFMLEHFGLKEESQAVWKELFHIFADGYRTGELANKTTNPDMIIPTSTFGEFVAANILRRT